MKYFNIVNTLASLALFAGCAAPAAPPSTAPAASDVEAVPPAKASLPEAPITLLDGELTLTPIPRTRDILVTHHIAFPANSLIHVTSGGETILADTPWTPRATEALIDWASATYGKRPALATISHFHLDASGGIAALEAANIPTVASEETVALLESRGESMRASLAEQFGEAFEGWHVARPSITFPLAEGWRTRIDDTEIEVFTPGHGHAPDNVVTWFPEERVLFGGCTVKGGEDLGNLADANLDTYAESMTRLEKLAPRVVVSGHGDRLDPGQLAHTHDLAEAARPH